MHNQLSSTDMDVFTQLLEFRQAAYDCFDCPGYSIIASTNNFTIKI
ncbi:MAG: hypothetical protein RMX35_20225 [Nostoc sp. DcaGUA01]|nr:hypothetical protein [Nostoc sp. DcaGUA01]